MASSWSTLASPTNHSDVCSGDLDRPSCELTSLEIGIWDAIATLRMVISSLSLLGSSSIIGAAIRRREITNAKVHPIFSLALADLVLALLWLLGGGIWLREIEDRRWCFAVSLLTVILVCVSVNLTAVYAHVTYSTLKETDLSSLLANMDSGSKYGCLSLKMRIIYSIAWGLPVVIVLTLFGAVAATTSIIQDTNQCSCWCAPLLGNVVPYAIHIDEGPADYVHEIRKLLVVYGLVISMHFLLVFIILIVLYTKSLKWIRNLKNHYTPSRQSSSCLYSREERGQMWALISRGESQARKRVIYFLTAFIINGFFNFVFSFGFMVREIVKLRAHETISPKSDIRSSSFETFYIIFATLQAVSVTQQGFLNAIVYGWTREDFVHIMSMTRSSQHTPLDLLTHSRATTARDGGGGESGDLETTWADPLGDEEEEEEGKGEREGKERSAFYETCSVTPTLPHKLYGPGPH